MHTHTVMVSSYWDKLKNIQLLRKEEQVDKFLRNLYEVRFMIRLFMGLIQFNWNLLSMFYSQLPLSLSNLEFMTYSVQLFSDIILIYVSSHL